MRLASVVAAVALVTGCAAEKSPATKAEAIQAIAGRCGLPLNAMQFIGKDELRFQPPADAKYEAVDCALRELKILKFPMKLGFVGNEAFAPEAK